MARNVGELETEHLSAVRNLVKGNKNSAFEISSPNIFCHVLWAAVSRRRTRPAWALWVQAVKSHDNQGLHQSNRVGWRVRPSNFFSREEIQIIRTFHNAFYARIASLFSASGLSKKSKS